MAAVAAKSRNGAVRAMTQPVDIARAVKAIHKVPPRLQPAVRAHLIRKAAGIAGASRHIPAHWHPSGKIRQISREHALKLAAEAGVTIDLSNADIDLAGRWKHGWIPLDAVAALVKAKKYHGGSEGRSEKDRALRTVGARSKGRAGKAVMDSRRQSLGRTKVGRGKVPERREARLAGIASAVERGEISTRRADKLAAAAGGALPTGHADGGKLTAVKSVSVMPANRATVHQFPKPAVSPATRRAQDHAIDRSRTIQNRHVQEQERAERGLGTKTPDFDNPNRAKAKGELPPDSAFDVEKGGTGWHAVRKGGPGQSSHSIGFHKTKREAMAHAVDSHNAAVRAQAASPSLTELDAADAAKARAADITIEHSGDGTLVHGTTRGGPEVAVLKENGFRWSRNLGAWYLPRTMGEASRAQRVKAVEARLGERVQVDRGDLAKSGTAAERAAAKVDRDRELAAHHSGKAKQLAATADAHLSRAREIGSHIPIGQPILVGHHSEGRHRRDLAKIDSQYRKGFEAHSAAQLAEERAGSAEARVARATNPQALSRRIDRNEAELRKLDRILDGSTSGPGYIYKPEPASEHRDRLEAMRTDLRATIAHDKATLAGTGAVIHSKATVKAGDLVQIRGSSYSVHKANPKTVEVHTHGLHLKYPYHEIQKHTPSEKALGGAKPETLRKVIANAPGTPLALAAQRELDKREGS